MLSVFVIGEIDEVGEAFLATPPWKSTTTLDRTAFTAFSTFWPTISRNWRGAADSCRDCRIESP
jgi:hypothetical protein